MHKKWISRCFHQIIFTICSAAWKQTSANFLEGIIEYLIVINSSAIVLKSPNMNDLFNTNHVVVIVAQQTLFCVVLRKTQNPGTRSKSGVSGKRWSSSNYPKIMRFYDRGLGEVSDTILHNRNSFFKLNCYQLRSGRVSFLNSTKPNSGSSKIICWLPNS